MIKKKKPPVTLENPGDTFIPEPPSPAAVFDPIFAEYYPWYHSH